MIVIPKQRGKCHLSSVSTIPQNRLCCQLNRISIKSTLTRSDSWKEAAWYWAYLAMVVWARALSQRHIFLLPVASQFSSAGWESWVHTSTRCSGLASTNVFVENSPKSAGGGDQNQTQEQVNKSHDVEDLLSEGWGGDKACTQFESSSQSSDDSDGVGGVCAELVQWGEESIPFVLQLGTRQETGNYHQMVKVLHHLYGLILRVNRQFMWILYINLITAFQSRT